MSNPFKRNLPTDTSIQSLHVSLNRVWDAIEASGRGNTAQPVAPTRVLSASPLVLSGSGSTASDHNSLGGIQGGNTGEYYHATYGEYTGSGTGVFVRANSPALTGVPTAPTPTYLDNSTAIATTAFIKQQPSFLSRVTVSDADYTITQTGGISIAYTALTAGRSVNLLSPSTSPGQIVVIADDSGQCSLTNTITVTGTIDGQANRTLNYPYASITLESNGVSGYTITANPNPNLSAGMQVQPGFTDLGTGSVTIGTGTYALFTNPYGRGKIKAYSIPGGTYIMTDGVTNYIVANYNNGSPVLQVITDVTLITNLDVIPVFTIYRNGTTLYDFEWDQLGDGLGNKLQQSIVKTQRYRAEPGGLGLGEVATRLVTIGAGKVWSGAVPTVLAAFNSSVNPMIFAYHVAGVWTLSTVTTYNNTQFDDGTNLQTTPGGKYTVNFLYRGVGQDNDAFYVLGNQAYSLGAAQVAQPPGSLPPVISSHCILVGRIIVSHGATTATQIDSAFTTLFTPTAAVDHNSLANLQGGTASEYYHLTSAEYTGTGTGNFVRLNAPTLTGNVSATSFNFITGLATVAPVMDGVAAVGTSTLTARQDHIHPVDTSRQAALGYTPINKAGDTGIGNLSMDALTATTGTFSGAVSMGALTATAGTFSQPIQSAYSPYFTGDCNSLKGNNEWTGFAFTNGPVASGNWTLIKSWQNNSAGDVLGQMSFDFHQNNALYTRNSFNYGATWSAWQRIIDSTFLANTGLPIGGTTGTFSGNVAIGNVNPLTQLQVGVDDVGEPLSMGSNIPVVSILGSRADTTDTSILRLIRPVTSRVSYPLSADFKLKRFTTGSVAPYTQLTIGVKASPSYDTSDVVDVLSLRSDGSSTFSGAATFASSVSMGALTATTGTFSGAVSMGALTATTGIFGNNSPLASTVVKVLGFSDTIPLQEWGDGSLVYTRIGRTSGNIMYLSDANYSGPFEFRGVAYKFTGSAVSMGALTATSGTFSGAGANLFINDTTGQTPRIRLSGQAGSWFWIDTDSGGNYLRFSAGAAPGTSTPVYMDTIGGITATNVVSGGSSNTQWGKRTTNLSDFNAGIPSGFYDGLSATGNIPGTSWNHLINSAHTSSFSGNQYNLQIAADFYDQEIYFRKITSSTLTPAWTKLISSANLANTGLAIGGTTGTFSGNVAIGNVNPLTQLQVGVDDVGEPLSMGSNIPVVSILGSRADTTDTSILRLIRPVTSRVSYPLSADFKLKRFTTGSVAPYTQLTIGVKASSSYDTSDVVDVLSLRSDGSSTFSGAATFASSVSMGALTATTGTFSGAVSMGALTATTEKLTVYTVATLPSGSSGMRSMVSDALAPTFGAAVVGGGAVTIPVYFDTTWKVG